MVASISTDSRSLKKDDLFVAIKGEKFDGHSFVGSLPAAGALGAVVSAESSELKNLKLALLVKDTTEALKNIAAGYLKKLDKIKVAGISGSNGKTTTKDMLGSILSLSVKTHRPKGSFNNKIGLPLTILETDSTYGALILEYGTNHPGEIAELAGVARPDAAGITNIGVAHIGNFRTCENILEEKWTLIERLKAGGVAAVNADDKLLACKGMGLKKDRCLTFSRNGKADLWAEGITELKEGGTAFTLVYGGAKEKVRLGLLGLHNVSNALCAAAIAAGLNVDIKKIAAGLSEFKAASLHRLAVKEVRGIKVIDDAYNANPDSVKGAISALNGLQANRKIIVLGEMAELGEYSQELHESVGAEVAVGRLDVLVAVGRTGEWYKAGALIAGMKKETIHLFPDRETTAEFLKDSLKSGDAVLIKGSRSTGMEKLVEKLTGE